MFTKSLSLSIAIGMLAFGCFPPVPAQSDEDSHKGRFAYVINAPVVGIAQGSVSVIDTFSSKIAKTISSAGQSPRGEALTPDGKRLYIANNSTSFSFGNVTVIDTATGHELRP
jgi:DNA-binding beta-propeller fold protein YncE